ncbi:hypothetical protein [Streptomyces sp. NPDC017941]|uniref:hypothetical protein n=1 Tax=unclassified Streptomyces TaxID=2593676 RepID=UPI0037940B1F
MTRASERDETRLRQLRTVLHGLVADGDRRAAVTGRRARRTLHEMAPGYERQPVLVLHRPVMTDNQSSPTPRQGADDACPLCGYWNCRCAQILSPAAADTAAPPAAIGSGQCNRCGMWFEDWNGGICDACLAVGR